MKKKGLLVIIILSTFRLSAQNNNLEKLNFIIGNWSGTGAGFGNSTSKISASYSYTMNNKYIEVKHESHFKPTEKNKKGEHHIDRGFISFDTSRKKIIYRQFNIEGFVNQYVLNKENSTKNELVFETEIIENFISGGKARLTIKKINGTEIQTIFDISMPNEEYTCYGTNNLNRIQNNE